MQFLTFALLPMLALPVSAAASLTWEVVTVPGSQPFTTVVSGINDGGEICGSFQDPGGVTHGFVRSAGNKTYRTIDAPDSTFTNIEAINNKGEVVGLSLSGNRTSLFLLDTDGNFSMINLPGIQANSIAGLGLNDDRTLTGFYRSSGRFLSFVCASGGQSCAAVAVPDSTETAARAINQSGQIVGSFTSGGTGHAFLRSAEGTYTAIDPPETVFSSTATAISSDGRVAGQYYGLTGLHNYIRSSDGQTSTSIDDPSVSPGNSYVTGINNRGMIVGYSTPSFDHYQGFIAAPMVGDLNGDGVVDCHDAAIVRASLGLTAGQPGFDPRADINGDGIVDLRDLTLVSSLLAPGVQCAFGVHRRLR